MLLLGSYTVANKCPEEKPLPLMLEHLSSDLFTLIGSFPSEMRRLLFEWKEHCSCFYDLAVYLPGRSCNVFVTTAANFAVIKTTRKAKNHAKKNLRFFFSISDFVSFAISFCTCVLLCSPLQCETSYFLFKLNPQHDWWIIKIKREAMRIDCITFEKAQVMVLQQCLDEITCRSSRI